VLGLIAFFCSTLDQAPFVQQLVNQAGGWHPARGKPGRKKQAPQPRGLSACCGPVGQLTGDVPQCGYTSIASEVRASQSLSVFGPGVPVWNMPSMLVDATCC
jgi:hypothetical protein